MHFLKVATLLPVALATASTLTKRSFEEVFDDVTGIDTAVRALTAQVEQYNGGIQETKPVFDASIDIHEVNRQGFENAVLSSRYDSDESARLVQHVSDTVGESIPAGLEVLKGKKDLFDDAELSSIVFATINLLQSDHRTFSGAVAQKLSTDQVAAGGLAAGKIDAALTAASLFYATSLTK